MCIRCFVCAFLTGCLLSHQRVLLMRAPGMFDVVLMPTYDWVHFSLDNVASARYVWECSMQRYSPYK